MPKKMLLLRSQNRIAVSMEMLTYLGIFVVSLAVLLKASDWFVDAAERIGLSFGIPPFVIGVTIIAFGTSLPELASSIAAVLAGEPEIVIGNVVGSNITNVALILGVVAIVGKKIQLEKDLMKIDMPLLLGSAALLWFIVSDQQVGLLEAIILLVGLVVFLAYSFQDDENLPSEILVTSSWRDYVQLLAGGTLVYFGADYTILGISQLSAAAGISPEIIALSLVALGTSLPELIVSISAARKGQTEIAVGNVIGSNIFNTYAVVAIPSFFGALKIPENVLSFSLPFMIALTALLAVMCLSQKISRWEGWMLFLLYCFFVLELFKNTL